MNRRGFTLLEMMVSLGLLSLMSAALFAILNTSFLGMSESANHIRRTQHVECCLELLRASFRKLPPSSWIKSLAPEETENIRSIFRPACADALSEKNLQGTPLLISGVAELFSWQSAEGATLDPSLLPSKTSGPSSLTLTSHDTPAAHHILSVRPQADGTVTLLALSPSWSQPLPLLDQLKEVHWRFLAPGATEWTDNWLMPARPALVELNLTLAERPEQPVRAIFWLAVQPQQIPVRR